MQDLNDKINNGGATAQGQLSADEWNEIPSEIQAVITSVGQALSGGDLTQLVKAIVSYSSNGNFFADSGIADAYVLTALGTKQGLYAYGDGSRVAFVPSFDNTGAATVNVSTLGVKDIKLSNGDDLSAGDITADEILELVYDLANDYFVLLRVLTDSVFKKLKAGNPSVLINGNFEVNQEAFAGGQPAAGVYGYDCWKGDVLGTRIEQVVKNALTINETYVISWIGGTGTADVDGVTGLSSGDSFTLNTSTDYSVIVPTDATFIKVERGSVATPYITKFYFEEAQACYARYYRIDNSEVSGQSATIGIGAFNNSTQCLTDFILPVTMISIPTLEISATNAITHQVKGQEKASTSILLFVGTNSKIIKLITVATGATDDGSAARVRLNDTVTSFIAFDARP